MNELQFKREMKKAEQLKKTGDADYWAAYQIGLRQGFEKTLPKKEQSLYVSYLNDSDPVLQQKGKGYRDGLTIAELKPKRGRPCNSESGEPTEKFTIRLTRSTIDNIPAPDSGKRQWVQKLIEKNVNKCTCAVPALPIGFTNMKKPFTCEKCHKLITS